MIWPQFSILPYFEFVLKKYICSLPLTPDLSSIGLRVLSDDEICLREIASALFRYFLISSARFFRWSILSFINNQGYSFVIFNNPRFQYCFNHPYEQGVFVLHTLVCGTPYFVMVQAMHYLGRCKSYWCAGHFTRPMIVNTKCKIRGLKFRLTLIKLFVAIWKDNTWFHSNMLWNFISSKLKLWTNYCELCTLRCWNIFTFELYHKFPWFVCIIKSTAETKSGFSKNVKSPDLDLKVRLYNL